MHISYFYLLIDQHLGSFHLLDVMNDTSINRSLDPLLWRICKKGMGEWENGRRVEGLLGGKVRNKVILFLNIYHKNSSNSENVILNSTARRKSLVIWWRSSFYLSLYMSMPNISYINESYLPYCLISWFLNSALWYEPLSI